MRAIDFEESHKSATQFTLVGQYLKPKVMAQKDQYLPTLKRVIGKQPYHNFLQEYPEQTKGLNPPLSQQVLPLLPLLRRVQLLVSLSLGFHLLLPLPVSVSFLQRSPPVPDLPSLLLGFPYFIFSFSGWQLRFIIWVIIISHWVSLPSPHPEELIIKTSRNPSLVTSEPRIDSSW